VAGFVNRGAPQLVTEYQEIAVELEVLALSEDAAAK
jgi:hypothetical protein